MRKDNNLLNNFRPHKDERLTLKNDNIEENYNDLISKSSDTKIFIKVNLLRYSPQNRLLVYMMLLSFQELRFRE